MKNLLPLLNLSRKLLLCAVAVSLYVVASAQKQQSVAITFNNNTYLGYLYIPSDYNTSTDKCPVILYASGTVFPGDTNTFKGQAFVNQLNSGMSLTGITNPKDGKKYSFIALELISNNFGGIPTEIRWLKSKGYRIDESRVYFSGFSQGGLGAVMAATGADSAARLIAGVVPMSSPNTTYPFDYTLVGKYKIPSWFFAGSTDGYTVPGTNVYYDAFNNAYPNSAIKTIYSGGHCCWNTFYDVNYRDPVYNMSIYQWMLQFQKPQQLTALPVEYKYIRLKRKNK